MNPDYEEKEEKVTLLDVTAELNMALQRVVSTYGSGATSAVGMVVHEDGAYTFSAYERRLVVNGTTAYFDHNPVNMDVLSLWVDNLVEHDRLLATKLLKLSTDMIINLSEICKY